MTLIKSLLLGSAAGIVAVATAQAADLPTRKAAPVEYVRVCNVGGITGWTLPGSDTCVKFSGYMTAHFIGGNISNQFNSASINGGTTYPGLAAALGDAGGATHLSQRIMVEGGDSQTSIPTVPGGAVPVPFGGPAPLTVVNGAAVPIGVATPGGAFVSPGGIAPGAAITSAAGGPALLLAARNSIFNRNAIGWNIRANFGFDLASNTAYGPLIGHFDINSDLGSGLDSPNGSFTYVNTGYVTWAGITAGKAQSFYSFIGGGDNWNNFFSPDQKGFNEPNLIAYTASFGGGFTATLAAQSQGTVGASGGGTNQSGGYSPGAADGPGSTGPTTFGGQRWPDIVGALHVKQGWGEAQVSGVIHNVNVRDYNYFDTASCGLTGIASCNAQQGKVGWGVDAGVKFNLTNGGWFGSFWGAGDDILFTGSYTRNAVWYSGIPDAMNGENGQVNGNGQPMILADSYFNPLTNQWSTPTAWSVSGLLEHHWTPTIYTDLEGSVGQVLWSGMSGGVCTIGVGCTGTGVLSPHTLTWLVGADVGWNPVTNLNFDLELMYQHTTQNAPSANIGTVLNTGVFLPGAWEGTSAGFQGRLRITRYF
jgi:Porin subfamily